VEGPGFSTLQALLIPYNNKSVPLGTLYVFLGFFTAPPDGGSQAENHVGRIVSSHALLGVLPGEANESNGIVDVLGNSGESGKRGDRKLRI
jgi:hypothetical protein